MIKVPFVSQFINDEVTVESSPGRDVFVQPFTVPALVMECDPYATDNGMGPDGQKPKWTVMLSIKDLDGKAIVVGAKVKANEKHPRMFVNSVHPNGDTLWLDCTSTEAV